jgi:hypothetical protein
MAPMSSGSRRRRQPTGGTTAATSARRLCCVVTSGRELCEHPRSGVFCKPSRKGPSSAFYEAAPWVNVSSTRLCPLSVAARVIAWCRQARASFYPRSKQWRHAGRRRTGGVGWGGTPSICRCSLGTRRDIASRAPSRSCSPLRVHFGRVPRSLSSHPCEDPWHAGRSEVSIQPTHDTERDEPRGHRDGRQKHESEVEQGAASQRLTSRLAQEQAERHPIRRRHPAASLL